MGYIKGGEAPMWFFVNRTYAVAWPTGTAQFTLKKMVFEIIQKPGFIANSY
ncbi:MAG: hypothetical protein LBD47_02450 [Treponema sp.]|jgi:hypothetical protein|nr:hypothetical protein [Treponema sp.]